MRLFLALALLMFGSGAIADALPQSPISASISQSLPDCGEGQAARADRTERLTGHFLPHCNVPLVKVSLSDMSIDSFRALIHKGDRAEVIAALETALQADIAPDTIPSRARELFWAFQDLHPVVDAFTQDWLTDDPASPLAQTARGWQLYQQGWAWRGGATAPRTWPESMDHMAALHAQALTLMRQAFATDSTMLPASDGVLQLDQTIGQDAEIPRVLETVMQVHPNRYSLMLAMKKLAPQWGGTQKQVDLLCARYAPKVTAGPGYDAATCVIDAAYFAEYWDGPRMDTARDALPGNAAPDLDDARLADAIRGFGTVEARKAILDKALQNRDFTPDEAMAWDNVVSLLKGSGHLLELIEYPKAVHRQTLTLRLAADNAPLDPNTLGEYRDALLEDIHQMTRLGQGPQPYPAAEMEGRLKAVLAAFPFEANSWRRLGSDIAHYGTGPSGSQDPVYWIETAEPYFNNAIAYGIGDRASLRAAVQPKLYWLLTSGDPEGPVIDYSTLAPAEATRLDAVVNCPALRQLILLTTTCATDGANDQQCLPEEALPAYIDRHFTARLKAGACPELATNDIAALSYSPVDVDLSPFN